MFLPVTFTGKAITYSLSALFAVHPSPASVDTTSASDTALARITTDTGDYATGHTSFTRYTTPQLCIGAVQNVQWLSGRSVESQVAAQNAERIRGSDSLSAAAIDVAQRCLASLSIAATLPEDFPDLLRLAIAAQQDSVVTSVLARHLALASTPAGRDSILSVALNAYLGAEPARLSKAAALVDQVAETGEAGKRWQIGALDTIVFTSVKTWNKPAMAQYANRVIDLLHALPPAHRTKLTRPMLNAFRALGMLGYLQGPDSLRAVATRARTLWHEFAKPLNPADREMMQWDAGQSESVDIYVQKLAPTPLLDSAATVAYPPVQASYWFPKPPPSGTTRLFFSVENQGYGAGGCLIGELELLYNPAEMCYPFYQRVRELAARYGSRLQIVLLAATNGQAIQSLPIPPKEEAERLKWYFLEYLKLPVTVGVIERSVGALPAPDGRQWRPEICNANNPESDMSVNACKYLRPGEVLLDRHGKQVPLWGPDAQKEHIIEQQVSQ